MATAYHMVHYRKLRSDHCSIEVRPEKVVREALNAVDTSNIALWQRINDRVLTLADEESRQLILNRVADLSSAVFGEMVLVQKGGFQAFIEMAAKKQQLSRTTLAEIYDLQERSAPDGSSFIRGLFYWIIIENHLLFVKTQSVTTAHFERYINWLSITQGQSLPSERPFTMQAEFDKSQVGGDIGDIQNLRLVGRSQTGLTIAGHDDSHTKTVSTTRKIADRFVEFGQALPLVSILFGPERTESLVQSLGPDEYLAVDASVKVRGRRTEASRERLRSIASELADFTDAEVRIEGKDGNVKDGDAILRTRMPFSLPHEGSNILEFDNVADQLQEVYSRFVHDGKITGS